MAMACNINLSPTSTFKIKEGYLNRRVFNFKNSIYKRLSHKSLPLFFRGGDVISMTSITNGVYEPHIKFLIDYLAEKGYSDFLIDIGANIGLTSCQSGKSFKEIHMFEPNPDCVNILKVNSKIALSGSRYYINEYGLGNTNEFLKLHIPRHNWGGAFIKHSSNSYSDELLASKDGYTSFDMKNYELSDIEVRAADEVLKKLFSDLSSRQLSCGIVKIDVEGFELPILKSIVDTLPSNFKLIIIFENWGHSINAECLKRAHQNICLKHLEKKKVLHPQLPKWLNSLFLFFRGGYDIVLSTTDEVSNVGDYVLEINT